MENHKNKQDNDFHTKEFIFCVKKIWKYDKIFFYACEHTAIQYGNTHAAKNENKRTTKWLPNTMQY